MPYAFVATQLSPSVSPTTPPLRTLTSLLSQPSPDPSIGGRFLSILPSPSSKYKECSLVTRRQAPTTSKPTGITFPINKPSKSSLKYSSTGSFGHGKETSAPTQPHVRRDICPSSSRKSVRFKDTDDGLESIRFFHATGRPSALLDPDSDTESDTDTDIKSDDALSSFPASSHRLALAGVAPIPTRRALFKVMEMSLIPSLYTPPSPHIYLESVSLLRAAPPLLHGIVRVRNITFEKRVAARFTIDDWTTVSEVLARYAGPVNAGAHLHYSDDGDDGKWDRFAFSISLGLYSPRPRPPPLTGASPSHASTDSRSYSHAFTLLLAVRFTVPDIGEWWDNNGGNNFRIVLSHGSAGGKVLGMHGPCRPQVVTCFSNAQTTSAMACTRALLKPFVVPTPTMVTN